MMKTNFGIIGLLLVLQAITVNSAEIRMKTGTVTIADSLVLLGDVADVSGENADDLKKHVIFPVPAEGKILNRQELRASLSQTGVDFTQHSFIGSSGITVVSTHRSNSGADQFVIQQTSSILPRNDAVPNPQRSEVAPKIEASFIQTLEKQIAEALNVYLNFTNKVEKSWEIKLHLSPDQAKKLAGSGQIQEITGGSVPFTGIQQFTIRMSADVSVHVAASVNLPTEIVVLRRSVPKGHILTASDLMYKKVDKIKGEDFLTDFSEAVGKETLKAVMELNPLTNGILRLPMLVHKGEVVTVRAANQGIMVRTEAVALQDGVLGDIISVEKINVGGQQKLLTPKGGPRKNTGQSEADTYFARIAAPKMVEVFVK